MIDKIISECIDNCVVEATVQTLGVVNKNGRIYNDDQINIEKYKSFGIEQPENVVLVVDDGSKKISNLDIDIFSSGIPNLVLNKKPVFSNPYFLSHSNNEIL